MAVLVWKHGTTKRKALAALKAALAKSGYAEAVTWDGSRAEARSGPLAAVLKARGKVTDEAVVLNKCGGLAGKVVRRRCRKVLARLFPDGAEA